MQINSSRGFDEDYKMGSEDIAGSKRHLRCSKCSMVFLLMFLICSAVPGSGFSLKSCSLSKTIAVCVEKRLTTIPQDIPPTVTGFDLSVNRLTKIRSSDFTPLPLLVYLEMNRNKILHIDSAAFATLTSLQKLNLNNNKVIKLEERVFDGLSNLTELRINHNQIKVVSSTSFQSLRKLKVLDISYNKLNQITDVHLILQHMPQLQELVLRGNSLKTFHSWELTNNSLSLCRLDLTFNPLEDFRITADVFQNLTCLKIGNPYGNKPMRWNLKNHTFLSTVSSLDITGLIMSLDDMTELFKAVNSSLTFLRMNSMKRNQSQLINISCSIPTMSKLHLRRNKLKMIHSDLFKSCVHLTELDLADNYIEIIQENAFTALKGLRILDLSRNKLSSVPNATRNLENLSELDLDSNNIRSITCQDFSNKTMLKELSLKNNSITALNKCAFKDLLRLQALKLQSNQIAHLNGSFENHLPNLKRLYLNGNKLTKILPKEFGGLRSLLNLSLHQNQMKELHKDSFVGLTNLTVVCLQTNSITRQALKSGSFNALINLRRLDLSSNHIKYFDCQPLIHPPFSNLSRLEELSIIGQHSSGKSCLPANFLQGLNNLLSFYAKKININYIDKNTFKYTPKLENLHLGSNDLRTLSSELFAPIQNLKNLYIQRTGLQSLDFFIDANLTKLEFLEGRHNQYSVITEDVIKSLPSLLCVDFTYISFSCDCDNAWFLNWTIANTQTQVIDVYNYSCNYPDDFKGKKLLDFDFTSCLQDKGFICFVSTTCMVLFVMVMSFSYHFMRSQLYTAYYLFWAWLFDSKYKNKEAPHQYDAFISYNSSDEPWVIGELLPKLEGEQGWRLCLHHRDFEPGKPIIDNITDAIYSSRKTICVISRRYLRSEWCSREVQTASFRLFDEQKDVLILVFLEDIPTYLLSPFHRMRKLLKKQTYLSWPRAANHPEVFWENLRKALQTGNDPNEEKLQLAVIETH
ncbi:toll-like receptor 13 [Poecilia reticulata]|uniref:toll-like receptor 13 n=1 Tax=Poecilia reticulata TaxID=8081 RepID=UPI0007EC131B|nr:PREDICTED: toll-like receptor 13 [Poecilia reticulata]